MIASIGVTSADTRAKSKWQAEMMRLILCQYKTDSEIRGYKALQIIERSNELTGVSLHEERETDNPEVLIHPKGKQ